MALLTPALGGRTARDVVAARLTRRDRDVKGIALLLLLLVAAGLTMLILFVLLTQIVVAAVPVFREQGLGFITGTIGSNPAEQGIWPGLYGSIFIGLGVVVVAIPLGIGAAIYLEEYASSRNRLTRLILVNIRNLAGVPAVIYGVLGLIIFVEWLEPVTAGETVITAGLTMAVLVLPIIIITAMEAIRAVPQGLRDAGYGVGASRWEVTRDHVLPYAAPGILTGTVLSIARALGEAAPLILIGALSGLVPRTGMTERFTALPFLIFDFSSRPDRPDAEIGWSNAAAAAGLVLLVLVLFFNAAAILLRNRFEQRRVGT
ncbi:MAG: phosphate ABC transporter permease PstA [Ilumatobacteraceae bacterium]